MPLRSVPPAQLSSRRWLVLLATAILALLLAAWYWFGGADTRRAAPAQAVATGPAAPAAAAKPAPAAEDLPPTLRELPDNIQREVPTVAIGGYIYSKNPEDRLLLVDKTLRHEGEEVAPGLTLEKLLPKAAVMRYKGYRYRVPY